MNFLLMVVIGIKISINNKNKKMAKSKMNIGTFAVSLVLTGAMFFALGYGWQKGRDIAGR